MKSNSKYVLHLGIYGEFAKSLMKVVLNSGYRRCVRLYGINSSDLALAPDGEVIIDTHGEIYDLNRYGVRFYLRKLGTLCQHTAYNKGYLHFESSDTEIDFSNSLAQMRSSKLADLPLDLPDCPTATIKHFILLAELFCGYKERKNALKNYDEEMVKLVLGAPNDPFTSSALQVLFDKIEELRAQQDNEHSIAKLKWEAEIEQIDKKYEAMLDKVNEEVKQLQVAAGQGTAAAAE